MACPAVIFGERRLFILSGFRGICLSNATATPQIAWHAVCDGEGLKQAAREHPDASVFGYTRGRWYAAA